MVRTPEALAAELEATFERIRVERMADVPILNDALRVEAVGFRPHGDDLIGVLVTPWFMNLMLLPADTDVMLPGRPGESTLCSFPAGDFEFIAGLEDGLGHYRMCSLFSPMFDFADHEAAVETAAAVMDCIMTASDDAAEEAAPPPRRLSRRELFRTLAGGEQP